MKIKSTIVVATAAGAALTPQAADAQTRGPGASMPPAPVYSWTGFYAGAHLGYAWQKNTTTGTYVDGATLYPFTNRTDPRGFVGGGQIGYNWQSGMLVYGLEADISGIGANRTTATSYANPTWPNDSIMTSSSRIGWLGTLRGRVGLAVTPSTIVYGTGGLAYGRVTNEHTQIEDGANHVSLWNASKTKTGYAAGGGIEHAFSERLTVRLEGIFADLGKTTLAAPNSGTCDTACMPVTFKNNTTILRGGVNFRF